MGLPEEELGYEVFFHISFYYNPLARNRTMFVSASAARPAVRAVRSTSGPVHPCQRTAAPAPSFAVRRSRLSKTRRSAKEDGTGEGGSESACYEEHTCSTSCSYSRHSSHFHLRAAEERSPREPAEEPGRPASLGRPAYDEDRAAFQGTLDFLYGHSIVQLTSCIVTASCSSLQLLMMFQHLRSQTNYLRRKSPRKRRGLERATALLMGACRGGDTAMGTSSMRPLNISPTGTLSCWAASSLLLSSLRSWLWALRHQ